MSSAGKTVYQDCYVEFDQSALILGNRCFRREFDLSGGLLHTVKMTGIDGIEIAGSSKVRPDFYFYGDRCTPEEMDYRPIRIGAATVTDLAGTAPHLHVTVSLYEAYQHLTLRKDFYIYPGLPALAMRCRIVSPVFPLAVWNTRRSVRERYQGRARENLIYEGCVDRLKLNGSFKPSECIEFRAQTDYNDEQVIRHPFEAGAQLKGNIFYLHDDNAREIFYFQEAPPSEERRDLEEYDFRVDGDEVVSCSWNLHPSELGCNKEFCSPRHVLFCCRNAAEGEAALKEYLRRRYLPERLPHYVTVNPWGDCDFYEKVSEKFLLDEIDASAQCGAELYQTDDGWQKGGVLVDISGYNKLLNCREFWQIDPKLWQGSLTPLSDECKQKQVDLSLWIAPFANIAYRDWREMAEVCLEFHKKYGVSVFKVDAVNFVNAEAERNLELMLRTVRRRSHGKVSFHFDVTAWGLRPGFFRFLEYGTVFLENRYTRLIRKALYHPERTWRNFWRLSRYCRIQEILCEIPSPNFIDYAMYREKNESPPDSYPWEYWLAVSLFAQMLMWFSPTRLTLEQRRTAASFAAWHKEHRAELQNAVIRHFGDEPDGRSISGLFSDSEKTLIVVLREKDCPENRVEVPCGKRNGVWKLALGKGSALPTDNGVILELPDAPGFAVWELE